MGFVGRFCCYAVCACAAFARADDARPLYEQIDAVVERRLAELQIEPAAMCDDAEFVRRVYLDLNGVIPTADEARAFLDDPTLDKRARLIDRLLARPDYALHMSRVFDVMLTERRLPTTKSYDVPTAAWRAYLAEAIADNRPWNQIAREIISGEGKDPKHGSAVKFYLVRDVDPHQLTRDVGRLFLGVDLQCAQCHDDPRIEEYLQADYYGLYAFLQRVKVHPTSPRGALVAEAADGKTTFTSVFTAMSGETNPRLPGDEMIADPKLEKGKEYVVKPGAKEPSVPVYSRRKQLAERLPRSETPGFSRNIANRMWAYLFGRGIVHPLDLHHAGNPPSHPELLDLLARWLVEHEYDLTALLREFALSRTYQHASRLPDDDGVPPAEAFAVARLRGLTPEQLRWSVLQATGLLELQAEASAMSNSPAAAASALDWKAKAAALEALDRRTADLVTAFSGLPGQSDGDFQPVVDQALFLLNSPQFTSLLAEAPGTRLARLMSTVKVETLAEDLYLGLFARRPASDEIEDVRVALTTAKSAPQRREALQALMRGLLLSAEFRLNH